MAMCRPIQDSLLLLFLPSLLFFVPSYSPPPAAAAAAGGRRDSIRPDQPIGDGDTIVSPGNTFVLGFFHRGNSTNRYLGMWYTFSTDTIVWVANRRYPITDASGVLTITRDGNLTLVHNHTNRVVWSSGTSNLKNPTARLLDTGNLVVKDDKADTFAWESFDHPSDTMLPGMKLGVNLRTGKNWFLTSWRTPDDPSPGTSFYIMDPKGQHEIYVRKGGNVDADDVYRLGPWNGEWFSGIPRMTTYEMLRFKYFSNRTDAYYTFGYTAKGVMVSRLVIHPAGTVERLGWSKESPKWANYWTAPNDDCDRYARCGPNGICDNDNPGLCRCLTGFTPKSPASWQFKGFNMGCKRKTGESLCRAGEGFLQVRGVKPPDTTNSSIHRSMSLNDCKENCLKNCSCTAYAAANIRKGTGCIMWYGDLIDTRTFASYGQNLHLRVTASELAKHKRRSHTALIVSIVLGVFVLLMCGLLIWKRKQLRNMRSGGATRLPAAMDEHYDSTQLGDDLPLFDFATIASITNNFSPANKIGQGGFGSVYKGTMFDGQQVAVKRLSMASGQGLDEFMNEATLIAKLQHRNLVRLLGCCIQGDERILIYEFMPNKSLDAFIFGKNRRALLNWEERVDIILGIARGLLYLHQDSRLRVIHRDLKAGNVLLDESMKPKISDFGTARLFGADQMEENTRRVIGTYGYMSPEYAMDGIFSNKSDVFSFGVLVLEIISGKKNQVFYHEQQDTNLLSLAWKLWKERKSMELLDGALMDAGSVPTSQVLRCVQIGLLCVQECAIDRPNMCSVVLMLSTDHPSLPEPRRPGFCQGRVQPFRQQRNGATSSSGNVSSCTINEVTFTKIEGR